MRIKKNLVVTKMYLYVLPACRFLSVQQSRSFPISKTLWFISCSQMSSEFFFLVQIFPFPSFLSLSFVSSFEVYVLLFVLVPIILFQFATFLSLFPNALLFLCFSQSHNIRKIFYDLNDSLFICTSVLFFHKVTSGHEMSKSKSSRLK